MDFIDLNDDQKHQYVEFCKLYLGNTIVFCETGEPLYFDDEMNMISFGLIYNLMLKCN